MSRHRHRLQEAAATAVIPVGTTPEPDDPIAVTRVLIRPVFLAAGDGRRRLVTRSGYLAAPVALAYLGMVAFCLVALPAARTVIAPSRNLPTISAAPPRPRTTTSKTPRPDSDDTIRATRRTAPSGPAPATPPKPPPTPLTSPRPSSAAEAR